MFKGYGLTFVVFVYRWSLNLKTFPSYLLEVSGLVLRSQKTPLA